MRVTPGVTIETVAKWLVETIIGQNFQNYFAMWLVKIFAMWLVKIFAMWLVKLFAIWLVEIVYIETVKIWLVEPTEASQASWLALKTGLFVTSVKSIRNRDNQSSAVAGHKTHSTSDQLKAAVVETGLANTSAVTFKRHTNKQKRRGEKYAHILSIQACSWKLPNQNGIQWADFSPSNIPTLFCAGDKHGVHCPTRWCDRSEERSYACGSRNQTTLWTYASSAKYKREPEHQCCRRWYVFSILCIHKCMHRKHV